MPAPFGAGPKLGASDPIQLSRGRSLSCLSSCLMLPGALAGRRTWEQSWGSGPGTSALDVGILTARLSALVPHILWPWSLGSSKGVLWSQPRGPPLLWKGVGSLPGKIRLGLIYVRTNESMLALLHQMGSEVIVPQLWKIFWK